MTKNEYELSSAHSGDIIISYPARNCGSLAGDGRGYAEALSFLRAFSRHYPDAVSSAVRLIARLTGSSDLGGLVQQAVSSAVVAQVPTRVREAVCAVACQLASCVFGVDDATPDCDERSDFHPEFVPCPVRAICPYNGYRKPAPKESICNPLYDLGLQRREAELVRLLATTALSLSDIAAELFVSEAALRQRTVRLYRKLGVDGRDHLRTMLAGKRVA